jgi:hypothetical protein
MQETDIIKLNNFKNLIIEEITKMFKEIEESLIEIKELNTVNNIRFDSFLKDSVHYLISSKINTIKAINEIKGKS